jgi:hypothetical protein
MRDRQATPLVQDYTATCMATNVPHHLTLRRTHSPAHTHTRATTRILILTITPRNPPPRHTALTHLIARPPPPPLDEPTLASVLQQLSKESVCHVKALPVSRLLSKSSALTKDSKDCGWSWWILNWAFGRWKLMRKPASFIVDDEGWRGSSRDSSVDGNDSRRVRGDMRDQPRQMMLEKEILSTRTGGRIIPQMHAKCLASTTRMIYQDGCGHVILDRIPMRRNTSA